MEKILADVPRRELTVAVFVRSNSLSEPGDETIRRLQQLESSGIIDALLVRAWPDEVPLSSDAMDTEVVEFHERFVAWADREGTSIEPPFESRTRHHTITGAAREVLTPPAVCLAVYENEILESVYPHADEDGHHTVADAIEALGDGQFQPAIDDRPRPPRDGTCPECGTGVVNVQGIVTCHDCTWVAATWSERPRSTVHSS